MTSLTSTALSIKKIGPVVIIGLIIIALVGVIIWRFTRKPEGPPPVPFDLPIIKQDPEQKQPKSFDFPNLKETDLPKELPVYTIEPYNITESAATTMASSLGFSGAPSSVRENTLDGQEFSWSQGDLRLTLSQTSIEYRDLSNQNQVSDTEGELTLDQLKTTGEAFIGKVGVLGESLKLQNTIFQTIADGHGDIADNFDNAQLAEFSFGKQLSGFSIVENHPGSALTTITITKNGDIKSFYSRFFEKFLGKDIHKLKTADEAIDEVQKGQGKIVQVRITNNGEGTPSFEEYEHPENIENAKIEKVSLAYFLPNDIRGTVQPIFVFEGSFKTNKNENGKVVIYLPAIKQAK